MITNVKHEFARHKRQLFDFFMKLRQKSISLIDTF